MGTYFVFITITTSTAFKVAISGILFGRSLSRGVETFSPIHVILGISTVSMDCSVYLAAVVADADEEAFLPGIPLTGLRLT